ncbi:MAG: protein-L-isoaspartate O-methyltransferase [Ponticaulis sp.]|nr:protein-L-isoaspartate O-methyltransferase [Ponticaulis sp.]
MSSENEERDPFQMMRLILELRQTGITDTFLLNAIESLPRHEFIPEELGEFAYDDVALPIACGQTITRPSTVAGMVYALELGEMRAYTVLEIGTGSGFLTALTSKLARRVYTVDRYRTLIESARQRFEALRITNIVSQCSDGALGWSATAPFDRIVSTCAVETIPKVWLDQLKPDGIMVIPVGTNEDQFVKKIIKKADGSLQEESLAPSKFLHLADGVAKEL